MLLYIRNREDNRAATRSRLPEETTDRMMDLLIAQVGSAAPYVGEGYGFESHSEQ